MWDILGRNENKEEELGERTQFGFKMTAENWGKISHCGRRQSLQSGNMSTFFLYCLKRKKNGGILRKHQMTSWIVMGGKKCLSLHHRHHLLCIFWKQSLQQSKSQWWWTILANRRRKRWKEKIKHHCQILPDCSFVPSLQAFLMIFSIFTVCHHTCKPCSWHVSWSQLNIVRLMYHHQLSYLWASESGIKDELWELRLS